MSVATLCLSQRGGGICSPTSPPHRLMESLGYRPRCQVDHEPLKCVHSRPVHIHLTSPALGVGTRTHACVHRHVHSGTRPRIYGTHVHTQPARQGHDPGRMCTLEDMHTLAHTCDSP